MLPIRPSTGSTHSVSSAWPKPSARSKPPAEAAALTHPEWLGLLVDREAVERESKRLVTRLKFANLRQNATVEDLNTEAARGLDKALFAKLADRRLDRGGRTS